MIECVTARRFHSDWAGSTGSAPRPLDDVGVLRLLEDGPTRWTCYGPTRGRQVIDSAPDGGAEHLIGHVTGVPMRFWRRGF